MQSYLLIPANFNAEQLLKQVPPKGYDHPIKPFALNFILYSICIRRVKEYTKDNNRFEDGFVPLKARYLSNVINRNYQSCLDYLENNGVINVIPHYIPKKQSMLYRLTDAYAFAGVAKVAISNKQDERIDRQYKKFFEATKEIDEKRPHLFKTFKDGKLSIKLNDALDWIDQREAEDYNDIQSKKLNNENKEKQLDNCKIKWQVQRDLVEIIYNGDYRNIHSDSFGYRLHSPVTLMKSELRSFLVYENQHLVSVDIKNSQLFSSLIFLEERFWGRHGRAKSEQPFALYKQVHNELYLYSTENFPDLIDSLSIMIVNFDSPEHQQRERFIKDVTSGQAYEAIMKAMNIEYADEAEYEACRQKVKEAVLMFLNEHPTQGLNKDDYGGVLPVSDMRRCFTDLYGFIVPLIDAIKSFPTNNKVRYLKEGERRYISGEWRIINKDVYVDAGYKEFASLLQRVESFLLLDVVCKELSEEWPNMPFVTVHDSIATTEEYLQPLKDKIKTTYLKYIGYAPMLG